MMSNRYSFIFVTIIAIATILTPRPASAQAVVDQANLTGSINWSIHDSSDIGQVFTAGIAGQLSGIELAVGRCSSPTDPMILEILTTSGGVPLPAPVLASVEIPNGSIPVSAPPTDLVLGSITGTYVDLSGFRVTVQAGIQYAYHELFPTICLQLESVAKNITTAARMDHPIMKANAAWYASRE